MSRKKNQNYFKSDVSKLPVTILGPLILLFLTIIVLPILIAASQSRISTNSKASEGEIAVKIPGCHQTCSDDDSCGDGLVCGGGWCAPGKNCADVFACYNPNCPYDNTCTCKQVPTYKPTKYPRRIPSRIPTSGLPKTTLVPPTR